MFWIIYKFIQRKYGLGEVSLELIYFQNVVKIAIKNSPGWTRTNNPSVNSRMLCHWATEDYLILNFKLLRIIQFELCQDILEVQQNYYNNKIFFYKHIFLLKLVQTAYFLKKLTIVKTTINGSKKGSNSCSSFKRQNKRWIKGGLKGGKKMIY